MFWQRITQPTDISVYAASWVINYFPLYNPCSISPVLTGELPQASCHSIADELHTLVSQVQTYTSKISYATYTEINKPSFLHISLIRRDSFITRVAALWNRLWKDASPITKPFQVYDQPLFFLHVPIIISKKNIKLAFKRKWTLLHFSQKFQPILTVFWSCKKISRCNFKQKSNKWEYTFGFVLIFFPSLVTLVA